MINKNIALYISGSIAAYKSAILVRLLRKQGANVKVIMTKNAQNFITPLTMQSLSKNIVYTDQTAIKSLQTHIELAKWTDIAIVAPATANIISKMANGINDNFATTAFMATTSTKIVVPAMNNNMWNNFAIKNNIKILKENGILILGPVLGQLAEGYIGWGRMIEPNQIIKYINKTINNKFKNINILISAGGTREPIDPVRYITNNSSGKMGYSLANEASLMGANVKLISTVDLPNPYNIDIIKVNTASEMKKIINKYYDNSNIIIMAAAVSDYCVKNIKQQKIKKDKNKYLNIKLIKNPDILKELSYKKKPQQYLVGFAAESQNLLKSAKEKLNNKNLNMIIANDISKKDIGFNSDNNEVTILRKKHKPIHLKKQPKNIIANKILNIIAKDFYTNFYKEI